MIIYYKNEEMQLSEESSAKDLAETLNLREPSQALAACVNGKVSDLNTPLKEGDKVEFLSFEDPKGKEVYWHTSAHVLAQAVLRLFPEALPTIGPPIENGFYYDFSNLSLSEEDFPKLEKEVKTILKENFKPRRHLFQNKEEAKHHFNTNPFKQELIEGFEQGSEISGYHQGEFFDLCRGPHLPNLGKIKAFKILKTSGAYWRGDAKKPMLTRIYAISFPDKKQLKDYLFQLEEAKKRDHRVLGQKLDLFSFKEEAPAMPFMHPRGMVIWNHLTNFWQEIHTKNHYDIIKTPQMMSQELWVQSGHWEHYRDNMFICQEDERTFAIKPMNCPGCMLYFKGRKWSYRELPMRIAEFGHVHRKEPSGALNGLFRVQSFHQDDAHLFMKPSDIKKEILNVLHLVDQIYKSFGLHYSMELSTRPEKSIGTQKDWDTTTQGLKEALDAWGHPYRINEGDGAFYGPKIDLHVQDTLGRSWQCGTIQLDMSLPEKFHLEYRDKDGSTQRPIMIHRAIFGSIERFLAILIEHFAGKFPLWISPLPIRLIPIADRHIDYARSIMNTLREANFICDCDETSESVSKKVRKAQLLQVNYMITVGDQELEHNTLSVRTRDNIVHGEMPLTQFLETLNKEMKERALHSPFTKQKGT